MWSFTTTVPAGRRTQAVVNDLKAHGVEAISHQGDLTGITEIARLVNTTIERFGRWDILVNTAASSSASRLRRPPRRSTTAPSRSTPRSLSSCAQAYSKMADNGRIINVVTTQVAVTAATYSAYAGSKAPVEHFTKAFAKEIGGRGITVNCIAPGPQKTSFFYNARPPRPSPGCPA